MAKPPPPADLVLETLNAHQRTHALAAAIELNLFTAIGAGHREVGELAAACGASQRGIRILCDYLVVLGLLVKERKAYGLTPVSAHYLDRESPCYIGEAAHYLGSPALRRGFEYLTAAVRQGGTALEQSGMISPNHEVWVQFARGMAPVMEPVAVAVADLVQADRLRPLSVLDLAAGHGLFGIHIAKRNPVAKVCAVDWPNVLAVAEEHARIAGVQDRYRTLPGSAFDVDLGHDHQLVLMTNFLHHFDPEDCVVMLRRVHAAMSDGGRAVLLEYVPNEDRVSPARAASFALVMLATTPAGDAYTYSEYREMLHEAGFVDSSFHEVPGSAHQVVIGTR